MESDSRADFGSEETKFGYLAKIPAQASDEAQTTSAQWTFVQWNRAGLPVGARSFYIV